MSVSRRAQKMKPFLAMELLEQVQVAAAAGEDVISLALGEPDFDAPECVKAAAAKALKDNFTKYTHSQGMLALREEIAAHYDAKYRVKISPEQIIVCSGTSPALQLIFGALLDAGDEFILPNPHYPCYPSFIEFLDGKPVYVPVSEADAFQYRPEAVAAKITARTKGVMLTSPGNPTGTVITADALKELAALTQQGPYIVSDEISHGLIFQPVGAGCPPPWRVAFWGGGHPAPTEHTILEFTDRAFVLNGFSKAYAMTGFRLGYCIVPPDFIRPMQIMQQNLFISANSFVQQAGIVALREAGADVERMRQEFDRRREVLLVGLKELGLGVAHEPQGAFYVFANAQHLTQDTLAFCQQLFEATGVAVTPGIDFGSGGEGYLRFSYANSLANIDAALTRLKIYLKSLG